MIPLRIKAISKEKNRLWLIKRLRKTTTIFIIACLLPFMFFLLFAFDVLKSKPPLSSGIEEPVAKVITNNSIGTAFLVSPTQLLTARHVVQNLNIGDEVIVDFQKANPPRQLTAKIKFYKHSDISPLLGEVPLDYFLTDIAVLEVQQINDITPMDDFGESDAVEELDEVILIGYPDGDYSKTDGSINSKQFEDFDLFKSNVTANPGNSGGPCILKDDQTIIGIIVGSRGPGYQGENAIIKINESLFAN